MAADAAAPVPPAVTRGPVSRRRVDILISRASAVFGLVVGLQAAPIIVDQADALNPAWVFAVVPVLYLVLAVAVVSAVLQRAVRVTQAVVAIVYVLCVVSWPLALVGAPVAPHATYWLYYLMTVATAAATVAFRPTIAATYLVAVPAMMAVVRATDGFVTPGEAVLNSVFSVILGGALIVIVTVLRQSASAVDRAQLEALAEYGRAVRQHAREAERVQVDSIVHDSVLTTLLSAARAETPETQALAGAMAGQAIGHLRDAARAVPEDGVGVPVPELARRISEAADGLGMPFDVITRVGDGRSLPVIAAEAVYAASVQAMVNSVQHAGDEGVSRWLVVRTFPSLAVEVEVGDAGRGFDPEALTGGRLGLRVSMVERVESAGGATSVESIPGVGTTIFVRWPREEPS